MRVRGDQQIVHADKAGQPCCVVFLGRVPEPWSLSRLPRIDDV